MAQYHIRVVVIRFDDRIRYRNGIIADRLFSGGRQCVISMSPATIERAGKRNRFAKVELERETETKGTLVELLGNVGEYAAELHAYQLHFAIKPCQYPPNATWVLRAHDAPAPAGADARVDRSELDVFSVDHASTRDIDDALSFEWDAEPTSATAASIGCTIGIHVADVASRIASNSALFAHARTRASSAYHGGIGDGDVGADSVPMLPPELAHGELSLNQGVPRNALSLFVRCERGRVVSRAHARTVVVNRNATTYAAFEADESTRGASARALLRALSGASDADELIAWSMIEYNSYFGEVLASAAETELAARAAGLGERGPPAVGLLRAQPMAGVAASYVLAAADGAPVTAVHASLGLVNYAHCSSPIRRYADLHNQHVLARTLATGGARGGVADAAAMAALNARVAQVAHYHAVVVATELAYRCRDAPLTYTGRVEHDDDAGGGRCLRVRTARGRVRVPLQDSYFAEPLAAAFAAAPAAAELVVELYGVLKGGRTQLRLRAPQLAAEALAAGVGFAPVGATAPAEQAALDAQAASQLEPPAQRLGALGALDGARGATLAADAAALVVDVAPSLARASAIAPVAASPRSPAADSIVSLAGGALDEARAIEAGASVDPSAALSEVNAVLGYPIDDFQQRCLAVLVRQDADLLAMAPTGSGKTAVALMAILQAFRRGQKAVYTAPIKALSNQKYAEFSSLFARRGLAVGISLLTGDIKERAPPGTVNELIICTSEILRNKLLKGKAAAASSSKADFDLSELGVVISDEVHYINDVERGVVWEETLMHLPRPVQLVALSATLREPEAFLGWIKKTRARAGELVVRTDRHVPLHVGGLDRRSDAFVEFFGTHGGRAGGRARVFEQATFEALYKPLTSQLGAEQGAVATATATALSSERQRDAQRTAFAGAGGGGHGGGRGGGGGGRGAGKQRPLSSKDHAEFVRLARALRGAQKLPAIVFCFSSMRCAQGARAVAEIDLIFGEGDEEEAAPPADADAETLARRAAAREEAQARARANKAARDELHLAHLERYMPYGLGALAAYKEVMALLARGVAYHHGGMLPVLREFVELCFQQKLVQLVFATETLAVGVNMPARTVVFTQLDKPKDSGLAGHRPLRPDEFWQMAGRAGRRGMDELGYVLYAPTLSVAGLTNLAQASEMREMLVGAMQAATSQLKIDGPFVLRHLRMGWGAEVLDRTLLADETERTARATRRAFAASRELEAALLQSIELTERLKDGRGGEELTQLQRRAIWTRLEELHHQHGPPLKASQRAARAGALIERQSPLATIENDPTPLRAQWAERVEMLQRHGFLQAGGNPTVPPSATLTARGRACAAFADLHPLIVGTIIADGVRSEW